MKHTTNFTLGKSFAASKKVITWLAAITTVVALTFASSCKDDEKVVAPNLTITSFSPTSGGPGTAVELVGAGFSPTASLNAVSINGKVCPVTSATATKVTITIPADAGSGFIMITVGGKTAQRGTFTFIPDPIPLVVTSISPTTGPKNTPVTITGTGFQYDHFSKCCNVKW